MVDKKQPKNALSRGAKMTMMIMMRKKTVRTPVMIKKMRTTMVTYKSRPCHGRKGLKCRDPLRQGSKHQLEELGCSWQALPIFVIVGI